MANLPINLLPSASTINPDSLFVVEQNGVANKVTADTFKRQWIGEQSQFKPMGKYESLTALRSAVPNPSLGDYYYVGSSAPYTVYAALNIGQSNPWVSVGAIGTDVQSTADTLVFSSGTNTGSGDISKLQVGSTIRNIKDLDALDLTLVGGQIPANSDLNDYTAPGMYFAGGTVVQTLLNSPTNANTAMKMVVLQGYSSSNIVRLFFAGSISGRVRVYYQIATLPTFPAWVELSNRVDDVQLNGTSILSGGVANILLSSIFASTRVSDLNNATTPGFYDYNGGSANAPGQQGGVVIVLAHGNVIAQFAIGIGSTAFFAYIRTRSQNNWLNWGQIQIN